MQTVIVEKNSKRKMRKNVIYQTANYLINEFKKEGIIIQRYDSKTSNSVYLKLDYGMLDSIRISDHKSKSHIKHKYNLLYSGCKPTMISYDTPYGILEQYFIPLHKKKWLVDMVKKERINKINTYGEEGYKSSMDIKIAKIYSETGFWRLGEIV